MKKLPKPFIFREREGPEETCYTKAQTEGYGFESRRVGRIFLMKTNHNFSSLLMQTASYNAPIYRNTQMLVVIIVCSYFY